MGVVASVYEQIFELAQLRCHTFYFFNDKKLQKLFILKNKCINLQKEIFKIKR